MKLSRLTNRQLRSLLRRGEVRFADDKKTLRNILKGLETPSDYLYIMQTNLKRTLDLLAQTLDPTDFSSLSFDIANINKKLASLIISLKKVRNRVEQEIKK